MADAVNTSGSTVISHVPTVPDCNLSSDMDNLLEKGLFSDVCLAVDNKEFKVHKAILAGVCVCVCVCTSKKKTFRKSCALEGTTHIEQWDAAREELEC